MRGGGLVTVRRMGTVMKKSGFWMIALAVLTTIAGTPSDAFAAALTPDKVQSNLDFVWTLAAAALVLFVSNPDKRSAALRQGILPLIAVAATVLGL